MKKSDYLDLTDTRAVLNTIIDSPLATDSERAEAEEYHVMVLGHLSDKTPIDPLDYKKIQDFALNWHSNS